MRLAYLIFVLVTIVIGGIKIADDQHVIGMLFIILGMLALILIEIETIKQRNNKDDPSS